MIKVYKNFNRSYEVFWGLSIFKLIQIVISILFLAYILFSLKLSPTSPLSLGVFIPWIIITALLIKSEDDFYLNLFLHPFQNHIYLLNKQSHFYPNIKSKINIERIENNVLYNKDKSLAQIIKIDYGLSINNLSQDERENLLYSWSNFLSGYNKISDFEDYFTKIFEQEQLETFIQVEEGGLNSNQYLVIRQEALDEDKSRIEKLFIKLLRRLGVQEKNSYNYKKEYELLKEKVKLCQTSLDAIKIKSKLCKTEEIKELIKEQIDIFSSKNLIIDKGQHLEIKSRTNTRYIKSYCLKSLPDSGDLDFWLEELLLRLKSKSFLSIKLRYRDPHSDRKKAESKASIISELKKSQRASSKSIITDNKAISEKLIEKPYSFDYSINLSIEAQSLEELKELDSQIKRPIRNCSWSSEERKQINGFTSNLPSTKIDQVSYRHYSDLEFATANFCFFTKNFPQDSRYFIGHSLTDRSTINLDESNKKYHKTRSINFIGDSGSGKSYLAKAMISQRLKDTQNQFVIIDNTKFGWNDFIEHHKGSVINLNTKAPEGVHFNPLWKTSQNLNKQILELINLFTAINDREKLDLHDKDFLGKSLRAFLETHTEGKFSDLYLFWSRWENRELASRWQSLISAYCKITNGAYSYLMDGIPSNETNKLKLYQFSTVNQEKSFSDLCSYLINQELEERITKENSIRTTLVVDEAWRLMQSNKSRAFLSYYARAGRAIETALWTISQKPKDLAKEIFSSASINISFHLKEKEDQRELKSLVGFEEHELELFQNNLLKNTGNCIIKTNYGTDLVQVAKGIDL